MLFLIYCSVFLLRAVEGLVVEDIVCLLQVSEDVVKICYLCARGFAGWRFFCR